MRWDIVREGYKERLSGISTENATTLPNATDMYQDAAAAQQGMQDEAHYHETQARMEQVKMKHVMMGLYAVTAVAGTVAAILAGSTSTVLNSKLSKEKATIHIMLNQQMHKAEEEVKIEDLEKMKKTAKQMAEEATEAINLVKKRLYPWRMRIKGGLKQLAILTGTVATLLAAYRLYLHHYEKIMRDDRHYLENAPQ